MRPEKGRPSPETQRDRVLGEDEIRAVWTAFDSEPGIIGDAFRLMLVTAQRRGEVLSMRWEDVDGTWWTIPAELAKNSLSHRVPLSRQAASIIERLRQREKSPWVFPSPTTERPIENPRKPLNASVIDQACLTCVSTTCGARPRRS